MKFEIVIRKKHKRKVKHVAIQLNGNGTATAVLNNGQFSSLPTGCSARWNSSDDSVLIVQQSETDPLSASLSPVRAGSALVTCTVTNPNATEVNGVSGVSVIDAPQQNTPVFSVQVNVTENNPQPQQSIVSSQAADKGFRH